MDFTTEQVMEWLWYLNGSFIRINGKDLLRKEFHIMDNGDQGFALQLGAAKLDLDHINVVWYRRWAERGTVDPLHLKVDPELQAELNNHRRDEFKGLSEYFFSIIRHKEIIGSPHHLNKNPSKMTQLFAAKAVGMKTPVTLVTNNKAELVRFYEHHDQRIIVKAIHEAGNFTIADIPYVGYTGVITDEVIAVLPERFYPSLFQEYLDKEVELRVFYLEETCYAMAIFSTLDKQTEVDFRKYNSEKPNRNVPFELPETLRLQVISLMKQLQLNTGSLDFILTKEGDFVFLEVNPGGQFGMVSIPCNYQLEKKVAELLITKDR